MKRFFAAFAVAAVLPAAPAVASYPECMRLCMLDGAPFKVCHDICKELATDAPAAGTNARETPATPDAGTGSPAAAPKAAESLPPIPGVLQGWDCSTVEGKADAVFHYILKTHDPTDTGAYVAEDDDQPHPPGTDLETASAVAFRVGMFLERKQRDCTGFITVTDDCRISEDFKCVFATE